MTGYLIRKKSKGNWYIYLRRSNRIEGIVKHTYIYSFGKMPMALNKLYAILNNEQELPMELIEEGYTINHIIDWIITIETGVTKSGKPFELT